MRFLTATAFRTSLNHRPRTRSSETGMSLARLRRQLVFGRLIARLSAVAPGRYVVKGGYALDVRLGERARTTKDLDLVMSASRETVVRDLAEVTALKMNDFFTFEVYESTALDDIDNGMAVRFKIRAMLADERFEYFDLDVGVDRRLFRTQQVVGDDTLAFAEVPPVEMALISVEQHLAEKLHAYT